MQISLDKLDHGNLGKRFKSEWEKAIQNMYDFPEAGKRKIKIEIKLESVDINRGKFNVTADCAAELVRPAPLKTNMMIAMDAYGNRHYKDGWGDEIPGQMAIMDYEEKSVDTSTGEIVHE